MAVLRLCLTTSVWGLLFLTRCVENKPQEAIPNDPCNGCPSGTTCKMDEFDCPQKCHEVTRECGNNETCVEVECIIPPCLPPVPKCVPITCSEMVCPASTTCEQIKLVCTPICPILPAECLNQTECVGEECAATNVTCEQNCINPDCPQPAPECVPITCSEMFCPACTECIQYVRRCTVDEVPCTAPPPECIPIDGCVTTE